MENIGQFRLVNKGAFTAFLKFQYYDDEKNSWFHVDKNNKRILGGQTRQQDLSNFNLPNGCFVRLYVGIHSGKSMLSPRMFIYEKGAKIAKFTVSGTTQNPHLSACEFVVPGSNDEIDADSDQDYMPDIIQNDPVNWDI